MLEGVIEFMLTHGSPVHLQMLMIQTAGYTPFRLEGYIRVVEKTGGTGITAFDNRPDEEKGVLEISKLRELATKYGIGDRLLGELFNSVHWQEIVLSDSSDNRYYWDRRDYKFSDSLHYILIIYRCYSVKHFKVKKAFKISSSEDTLRYTNRSREITTTWDCIQLFKPL